MNRLAGEHDVVDEDGYISGIFNYCDRWCERCGFVARCRVGAEEQRRLERHLLRGEDPDDPEVFMADLHETFGRTIEMLQDMAAEMEVDLEPSLSEEDEEIFIRPREDAREHPLYLRSMQWSQRLLVLLKMVHAEWPTPPPLDDGADPDEPRRPLPEDLADALPVLHQYVFLISVKMARALGGWAEWEDGRRPYPEFARDEAWGTAKLVLECLGKTITALEVVEANSPAWAEMAGPLREEASGLMEVVKAQFLGYEAFHRPGFDDV